MAHGPRRNRSNVSYRCPICSFELWHPVGQLNVSALGFYDDARFPGRCLLVLNEHADDLAALEPPSLHDFVDDAVEAAKAIRSVTQADRVNYAVLGNAEPHLHFHLVPRKLEQDPIPTRPPWEHPGEKEPLPGGRREQLIEALRSELSGGAP